jgi:hypothetical protein
MDDELRGHALKQTFIYAQTLNLLLDLLYLSGVGEEDRDP